MDKIFIGIDPGTTTGWYELWDTGEIYYSELQKNEVEPMLENRLEVAQLSYVGCERFVTTAETAKKSAEHGATDIEGVVKNSCEKFENCTLVLQTPAEKKRVPDKMLKAMKWWVPGHRHAMDGARHLILVLADHDPIRFDKIVNSVIA